MIPFVLSFVLIFHTAIALGQQLPSDEGLLKTLLVDAQTAKDSVKILNELSWQTRKKDPRVAKHFARTAIALSERIEYAEGLSTAHNRLGSALQNEGLFLDSALLHFHACYEGRLALQDTMGALGAKNNMALILANRNEYTRAAEIYKEILVVSEKVGDLKRTARSKMNLGNVYNDLGEFHLALQHFADSKKIWEDLGNEVEASKLNLNIANVYEHIYQYDEALRLQRKYLQMCLAHQYLHGEGMAYNNMGNIHLSLKNYDSAGHYYHKGLVIKKHTNDYEGIASSYRNLGILYNSSQSDFDSAKVYVQKSLKLHRQRGDSLGVAKVLISLGNIQMNTDAYQEALLNYQSALHLANQYHSPLYMLEILRNISHAYEKLEDYDKSLEYIHRFHALQDTLSVQINQAYQQELALNKARHQANVLDLQVRQRNMVIGGLVIGLVLTLALLIALLNASKQKRIRLQEEQRRLEAEQIGLTRKHEIEKLLKDQELKSIGQVLEAQDQERKRIAQDLHDRLGSMLSMVKLHFQNTEENIHKLHQLNKQEYDRAISLLDEACDEVRKISHNLVSGVLKNFGLAAALEELKDALTKIGKLEVDLVLHNMDERLNYDQEVNIYRIIQEAINNILKHAEATYVSIQLVRTSNELRIMVEDNGVGFDMETIKGQEGIGLKNIESRVAMLGGEYDIDSTTGRGTTLTATIPTTTP